MEHQMMQDEKKLNQFNKFAIHTVNSLIYVIYLLHKKIERYFLCEKERMSVGKCVYMAMIKRAVKPFQNIKFDYEFLMDKFDKFPTRESFKLSVI